MPNCRVRICLVLQETTKLSPKVAILCIPTRNEWELCCSTLSLAFGSITVPTFGHSNKCVVVSHFNLHFPDAILCGTSLYKLIFHLYIFFGKISIWITALYQICLLQIFYPNPWLVFSFSWHLIEQKVFNFNEAQIINYFLHISCFRYCT